MAPSPPGPPGATPPGGGTGSAGPGGNYAFYADPGTDSLILRARRTTNDTARTTLYRRIDERVYRAAPWLYLWFPTDLWARRPELVGWDLPVIFNGQRWTLARVAPRGCTWSDAGC